MFPKNEYQILLI